MKLKINMYQSKMAVYNKFRQNIISRASVIALESI